MSAINTVVRAARLCKNCLPFDADQPYAGQTFEEVYPRIDGDDGVSFSAIVRARVRVKTYHLKATYTLTAQTLPVGAGEPTDGAVTTQVFEQDLTLPGDPNELTQIAFMVGNALVTPDSYDPSDPDSPQYIIEPTGPTATWSYSDLGTGGAAGNGNFASLSLTLILNNGADDPTLPFLLTFIFQLQIQVNPYGTNHAAGATSFPMGQNFGTPNCPGALTFFDKGSGPQTWDMQGADFVFQDPSTTDPTKTQNFTHVQFVSAVITEKEYFTWDGVYDPTTGTRAGS